MRAKPSPRFINSRNDRFGRADRPPNTAKSFVRAPCAVYQMPRVASVLSRTHLRKTFGDVPRCQSALCRINSFNWPLSPAMLTQRSTAITIRLGRSVGSAELRPRSARLARDEGALSIWLRFSGRGERGSTRVGWMLATTMRPRCRRSKGSAPMKDRVDGASVSRAAERGLTLRYT